MHKHIYTYGLLSVVLLISMNAHASLMKVKESSLHARGLENVELFHDDNEGFSLKHNGIERKINSYSVSPELRNITSATLSKYQDAAFLSVVEQSDGEVSLKSHVRGESGGLGGAQIGFLAGKFITSFLGQAAITAATTVVTIVCPPAAVPFDLAARAALTPMIEGASLYVALAGGILGGAATGPV